MVEELGDAVVFDRMAFALFVMGLLLINKAIFWNECLNVLLCLIS